MKFNFKCNLSGYRTPSQLPRIAQLKARLERLGCGCDSDAVYRFDFIQKNIRADLYFDGFVLYSDGGRLTVAESEEAFEEDANYPITLPQLEYLCLILCRDYEDATHYIKRGTYRIPVLAVKSDGKNFWHYYENGRWIAFDHNDKEGLKKLFGKKFEWAVNKFKPSDKRNFGWDKSLQPPKPKMVVSKARPQTAFNELW